MSQRDRNISRDVQMFIARLADSVKVCQALKKTHGMAGRLRFLEMARQYSLVWVR